jgi:hypothetical protein
MTETPTCIRIWLRVSWGLSSETSTSRMRLLAAERFSAAVWMLAMAAVSRLPAAPNSARDRDMT